MKKFSLKEIAEFINGQIQGDQNIMIEGISDIRDASSSSIAVLGARFESELDNLKAKSLVVSELFFNNLESAKKEILQTNTTFVIVKDPYLAMALITKMFHEEEISSESFVHPTAVISSSSNIFEKVSIHAKVIISDNCEIYSNVEIMSGAVIGKNVRIGSNTKIFPNVVIYDNSVIGQNCRIHAGAVIGADGFGYARRRDGHEKIWHFGKVIIGDNVEIGANTTIDRGTMRNTVIGNNVKIDNQVQLGHNDVVEDNVIICGCTGIAGGAVIRKNAIIAGAAGLVDKVEIGENSIVAAMTLVTNDVPANTQVAGIPHREKKDFLKVQAALSKLPEFIKRKKC